MYVNTHKDAKFDKVSEAFCVVAHETAHVIENCLEEFFTLGDTTNVPDWLEDDVDTLLHQDFENAYIPARIFGPYCEQVNEHVAIQAEQITRAALCDSFTAFDYPIPMVMRQPHASVRSAKFAL